jgi:hypothetical protein
MNPKPVRPTLSEAEIEALEDAEDLAELARWDEEKRAGTAKTVPLAEALKNAGLSHLLNRKNAA